MQLQCTKQNRKSKSLLLLLQNRLLNTKLEYNFVWIWTGFQSINLHWRAYCKHGNWWVFHLHILCVLFKLYLHIRMHQCSMPTAKWNVVMILAHKRSTHTHTHIKNYKIWFKIHTYQNAIHTNDNNNSTNNNSNNDLMMGFEPALHSISHPCKRAQRKQRKNERRWGKNDIKLVLFYYYYLKFILYARLYVFIWFVLFRPVFCGAFNTFSI